MEPHKDWGCHRHGASMQFECKASRVSIQIRGAGAGVGGCLGSKGADEQMTC